MGLDLSKIPKLISDLCSEISCRSSCCHDGVVMEFDNKDSFSPGGSETSPSRIRHQISKSTDTSDKD